MPPRIHHALFLPSLRFCSITELSSPAKCKLNIHEEMESTASASPFKLWTDFECTFYAPPQLILGSSSIARRNILAEMGYEFTIASDAIIAKLRNTNSKEKDAELPILVAADTAEAILQRLPINDYIKDAEPMLLITSDQVVVYEGEIREKPSSAEEGCRFMKDYSGGHCATVGSVLVTNIKTGFRKGEWDRVEIYFHEIPDEVIAKLIEEGIVLKAAGGLIIEHPLVLPYIKEVVGTKDSVMGLPKALTEKLIKEAFN